MHGKNSLKKEIRQLQRRRRPKAPRAPSTVLEQLRLGKWILQENAEGSLEAVHSETGDSFLVAQTTTEEQG